jgi:integrase
MSDLGHLRLDDVTTPVFTTWVETLRTKGALLKDGKTRGKPLGDAAVGDFITTLRAIFRVATEQGYIDHVPFCVPRLSLNLDTDREAWTDEMKERLLKTATEKDVLILRLAMFLMLTGCRPIEALRLRWAHVQDVPTPLVDICGKGLKRRKLPLTGNLGEFFSSLPRDGDYVFGCDKGRKKKGKGLRYFPQSRWEAVCKAAEVPTGPYDLRHTFITEMVADGVEFSKVAKWCGNSQRVIEERYCHLSPAHLSDIADRVGKTGTRKPETSARNVRKN